jgi:hypothetical protein
MPLKAIHMGPQLKMNQTGWQTTSPLLHPQIMRRPVGFDTWWLYPSTQEGDPGRYTLGGSPIWLNITQLESQEALVLRTDRDGT